MEKDKERSHCSARTMPAPEFTVCTGCGDDVEIWTDEDDTICSKCGRRIYRKEKTGH